MEILLTGGTGYIASHTAVVLVEAGHNVFLYDNLSNSCISVVERLHTITGQLLTFIEGDVRDTVLLSTTLKQFKIEAVIHFAGLKAVGESTQKAMEYYDNNIAGTISLLKSMREVGINNITFSSSATVYGEPEYLPLDESHPLSATNPYSRSKLYIETILKDLTLSGKDIEAGEKGWRIINLRYFNPIGAHTSGLIGEEPSGIPNNLMPYISQVAAGKLPFLKVFGNDYPTPDGTGVRDYIHVMDIAEGHLAALNYINSLPHDKSTLQTYNLGTGIGYSVLEIVTAFEKASTQDVPFVIAGRRSGDVPACYAGAEKAKTELGWTAIRDLEQMCITTWKFQQNQEKLL